MRQVGSTEKATSFSLQWLACPQGLCGQRGGEGAPKYEAEVSPPLFTCCSEQPSKQAISPQKAATEQSRVCHFVKLKL